MFLPTASQPSTRTKRVKPNEFGYRKRVVIPSNPTKSTSDLKLQLYWILQYAAMDGLDESITKFGILQILSGLSQVQQLPMSTNTVCLEGFRFLHLVI
jgi:hypothetical protein